MAESGLAHKPFRFQRLKDDRVFLYHHDRHVVTLAGATRAGSWTAPMASRATKTFKRGNEKP